MNKLVFFKNYCIALLMGASLSSIAFASDVEALFCDSCSTEAEARATAAQYAPALECSTSGGDSVVGSGMTCSSQQVHIILVNPQTDDVFSFAVGHSPDKPWTEQVNLHPLSNDVINGLKKASRINREFRARLTAINSTNFYDPSISYSASLGDINDYSARSLSDECPIDTALATLSDKNFLQKAVTRARIALQHDWDEIKNEKGFLSQFGIGRQYRGVEIDVQYDLESGKPLLLREEYTNSEVSPIFNDVLIYNLSMPSQTTTSVPDISLSLNSASRVAGLNMSAVSQGLFTDVDNECVKQRLEEWAQNSPDVTIGPDNSESGFPSPGPGANPGHGPISSCQIVTFQQHGNNPQRYSFRICR